MLPRAVLRCFFLPFSFCTYTSYFVLCELDALTQNRYSCLVGTKLKLGRTGGFDGAGHPSQCDHLRCRWNCCLPEGVVDIVFLDCLHPIRPDEMIVQNSWGHCMHTMIVQNNCRLSLYIYIYYITHIYIYHLNWVLENLQIWILKVDQSF